MTEFVETSCPHCGERFEVGIPSLQERPCRLDYDCEICCAPMSLVIDIEGRTIAEIS